MLHPEVASLPWPDTPALFGGHAKLYRMHKLCQHTSDNRTRCNLIPTPQCFLQCLKHGRVPNTAGRVGKEAARHIHIQAVASYLQPQCNFPALLHVRTHWLLTTSTLTLCPVSHCPLLSGWSKPWVIGCTRQKIFKTDLIRLPFGIESGLTLSMHKVTASNQ